MKLDARLLEVLACPVDKGPLLYLADERLLYNPRARLVYRVEDGIPRMLPEDADAADAAEHGRLTAQARRDGARPDSPGADSRTDSPSRSA